MEKDFLEKLKSQIKRKDTLYDGINATMSVDTALRLTIEELGEIATAITRDRLNSAMDECIDLAHCALLIYNAIERNKN